MKKMIVLLIVFLGLGTIGTSGTIGTVESGTVGTVGTGEIQFPFFRPTKNKPIKRMTKRQVKKVQKGKNFYVRKNCKSKRNR